MMGASPWQTKEQYLDSKLHPKEFVPTQNMLHGRFDEQHNMKKFEWITGLKTRSTNLFMASTRWPELASTIDGVVTRPVHEYTPDPRVTKTLWPMQLRQTLLLEAKGRVGLIEMKQTEVWYGRKEWLNPSEPPRHYQLQLQAQLHVTGLHWGILCARVGAAGMMAFYVERDDSNEFVGELVETIYEFRSVVLEQ